MVSASGFYRRNRNMDLFANIGQLVLDFILGLIENLLAPIFEGIFGAPAE